MSKEEKIIDNTILDSKVLSDSDLDQVSGGKSNFGHDQNNPLSGGMKANTMAIRYASQLQMNHNLNILSALEKDN